MLHQFSTNSFWRINCCCGYYPRCGPRSFLLLFKLKITWKEKLKKIELGVVEVVSTMLSSIWRSTDILINVLTLYEKGKKCQNCASERQDRFVSLLHVIPQWGLSVGLPRCAIINLQTEVQSIQQWAGNKDSRANNRWRCMR